MALNSDRDGFLIADQQQTSDLAQTLRRIERNTDAILQTMQRTRALDRARITNPNSQRSGAPAQRSDADRTSVPVPGGGGQRARDSNGRFMRDPAAEVAGEVRQLTRQQAQQLNEERREEESRRNREGTDQQRDARGRFGAGGGSEGGRSSGSSKDEEKKGFFGRMKEFFKERSGNGMDDAKKVDPVVESATEVMGMVGSAFGGLKTTYELGKAVTGRGFGDNKGSREGATPWHKRVLQQLGLMRREGRDFHRAELRALGEQQGNSGGGGGSGIIGTVLKYLFSPLGAAIVAAIVAAWVSIGDRIVGAWNGAIEKISALFEPIAKWFSDKFGIVTNTAQALGNKVNEAVKDATGVDVKEGINKAKTGISDAKDWAAGKLASFVGGKNTDRDFKRADGAIEQRRGGTISWRNNNPGNMKFGYKGSADTLDPDPKKRPTRSKEKALADARRQYGNEIIDLDQFGNAIFSTPEAGRAGQAKLLKTLHKGRTIEEMLPHYAINDYSGKADHAAYAKGIHQAAAAKGLDLRGKKIGDLTEAEMSVLQDGMKKMEGYKEGKTTIIPAASPSVAGTPAAGAPPAAVLGAPPTQTAPGWANVLNTPSGTKEAVPPYSAPALPSITPVPASTLAAPPRTPSVKIAAQSPPPPAPRIETTVPMSSKGPLEVTVRNPEKPAGQDLKDRRLAHIATGGMSGT